MKNPKQAKTFVLLLMPTRHDNFGIQASENDITFHTIPLDNGIGEERMRIVGDEHDHDDGHVDAGMYSYYLVADGKTMASKKMVVSGK